MPPLPMIDPLPVAGLVGGVAFAFSGYLMGVRKGLDIMGIFIVAFLTANGGGVVRDLLVGRQPGILLSTDPFWLVASVVAAASLLRLQRLDHVEHRWTFIVCDAVGLVAFAITGALIGLEEGLHMFGILMLALLTATGGGIIRDLLVNEVPEVLHGGFYGSVALLLAAALYALDHGGWLNPASILAAFVLALATRLIAYRWRWRLPKI